MDTVTEELRPDMLHVIFEKISSKTIFALHDPDHEILVRTIGQIQAFNRQGFTVLMINGSTKTSFTVKGHSTDEANFDIQVHLARLEEKIRNDYS